MTNSPQHFRQFPALILLLSIILVPAYGQEPAGTGLNFNTLLERADRDNSDTISKAEFRGRPEHFDRIDSNGDGQLTREEFESMQAQRKRSRVGIPNGRFKTQRDVVFGKGGERDLLLHIVLPEKPVSKPSPVYVWIHGGGWQGGTKDGGLQQVASLVQEGFIGATIEYRLTGEASFPAQIQDCKCAIRFLRAHAAEYNIDPDRIAVGGSSAGGHLAALMGTSGEVEDFEGTGGWADQSSSVQAVVDLYGPTDFKLFVTEPGFEAHNRDGSPESKLLGGGEVANNVEGIKRVNPITYVDENDPPFLIIHGASDRTVPVNQSQAIHDALKAHQVPSTLHVIADAGHGGTEFSQPEIRKMIRDFLVRTLKPVQ
ncbi:MAG: alpha/beta hydrolase fold domain-containing protein [Planctomycetaceae bacterium]|nr:alpha/beta hydrolase fold domain-containing protein [Planctomycetaceae bacterium]